MLARILVRILMARLVRIQDITVRIMEAKDIRRVADLAMFKAEVRDTALVAVRDTALVMDRESAQAEVR
jgi:hypothetical protein